MYLHLKVIDTQTNERLVTLRLMLEDALARTSDPTPLGRHSALVLLDGACEMAVALGLGAENEKVTDRFFDNLSRLKGLLGPNWSPPGWQGVHQLHRSRNSSQHHGIWVDQRQLGQLAAEAETFVHSLVSVVFAVDLRTVSQSAMIRDEGIRNVWSEAEAALAVGDFSEGLRHVFRAFDLARRGWLTEHHEIRGALRRGAWDRDDLLPGWVRNALDELFDFTSIQPFAIDLGEYLWTRNLRNLFQTGVPANPDEVRRASAFVFSWILRWQSFSASYTADRLGQWRASIRPPSTGSQQPRVIGPVRLQHGPVKPDEVTRFECIVTLQLVDAPQEDLHRWLGHLNFGLTGDLWRSARVDEHGLVTLWGVSADVEAKALVNALKRAISFAEDRRRANTDHQASLAAFIAQRFSQYEESLGAITLGEDGPVFSVISHSDVETRDDEKLIFRIDCALSDGALIVGEEVIINAMERAASELGIAAGSRPVWNNAYHTSSDIPAETAAQHVRRGFELATQDRTRGVELQLSINARLDSLKRDIESLL